MRSSALLDIYIVMSKPNPQNQPIFEGSKTLLDSAIRTLEAEAGGVAALTAAIRNGLGAPFVAAIELIRGVPVDDSVAAILWLTCPDLPMPVTITRPRTPRISSMAATKGAPSPLRIAAVSAATPPASASRVRIAESSRVREFVPEEISLL